MALRVLVCGGRDYHDRTKIMRVLDTIHNSAGGPISHIIHGGARGADTLGGRWTWLHPVDSDDPADLGRYTVEEVVFPVTPTEWAFRGKAAGFLRNEKMLTESKPDLVVAFPGGKGTAHMVRLAEAAGVPVIEVPGSRTDPRPIPLPTRGL